ncbi:extracellular solute-binding protein [Halomonas piscis]|uniref:extracellular solute-binding protein n=1 Tax=Halomonas piscis TaxID=3031727 RepID=UPI0028A00EA4|nr:extracellular solute-binding protein [Halomonas piscis]
MHNVAKRLLPPGSAALAALLLAGSTAALAQEDTLTIYNGQHKDATLALIDGFEDKTGISVETRNGSSNELAHQIVEEGDRSPADIIYTEESTPLIMLAEKGLLATIDDSALANIPQEYQGDNGEWVGLLARSRVVVYNKDQIDEESLPSSVKDFADPEWDGRFAFVKTSGAFQKQLSAMIKLDGREAAKAWLEGLKNNGKVYRNNVAAMNAVERGEIPAALINNYYWDAKAREEGAENLDTRLYFFGTNDLGDLVTVSGAAILASSENRQAAQKFMTYATGEEGQQILTDESAQYPLNPDVDSKGLKPFSELTPPNGTLDLGEYSNGDAAIELLQEVGLL